MKALTILIIAIFLSLTAFSQQKNSNGLTITPNPINIGITLLDEPSEEAMANICKSYNLTESPSQDGFHVYITNDGSQICFKTIQNSDTSKTVTPIVKIISSKKLSKINKILNAARYQKSDPVNGKTTYIRGSKTAIRYKICTIFSPSSLLLTKSSN